MLLSVMALPTIKYPKAEVIGARERPRYRYKGVSISFEDEYQSIPLRIAQLWQRPYFWRSPTAAARVTRYYGNSSEQLGKVAGFTPITLRAMKLAEDIGTLSRHAIVAMRGPADCGLFCCTTYACVGAVIDPVDG